MHRHREAQPLGAVLPYPEVVPHDRDRESLSWREAGRSSVLLLRERPGLIAVALAGFLARGGLLLFILPFVVLPTPVGVANWIGPTSVTASGPTERLLALIATIVAAAVVALALGTLIGAIVDLHLFRTARRSIRVREAGRLGLVDEDVPAPRRRGGARLAPARVLAQLVLIRLVAMVPLGLALAWSAHRFGAAAYHELILPQELVTPFVLRVLDQTRDAILVVVVAWLGGELVGGIAVRHHLRRGDPVPLALLRPIVDTVRRPITTSGTFLLGAILPLLVVAPLLAVVWFLFGGVRFALAQGEVTRVFATTVTFVGVWAIALVAAGVAAAWRSLLGSFEVLRAEQPAPVVALAPVPLAAEG